MFHVKSQLLNQEAEIVSNTKEGIMCHMCFYSQGVHSAHKSRWQISVSLARAEAVAGGVEGSYFLMPGLCLNLVKWDDRS